MKKIIFLILFVFLFYTNSDVLAGPYVTTAWKAYSLDNASCLVRSQTALTNSGYTLARVSEFSVFGEKDDKTAVIRCDIASIVVFVISFYTKPTINEEQTELEKVMSNMNL